tara:strand:+ start:2077 stop:2397 length:321 start_codon:yes stop_codon:yes gene_type:complete
MNRLVKGITIGVSLFSFYSSAVEWGAWTEVNNIYIDTSGSAFITFASLPGCYNNQGAQLRGSDVDKAYATILAAFMAKKKVRPLYNTKEGVTGWDMCTISSFFIAD